MTGLDVLLTMQMAEVALADGGYQNSLADLGRARAAVAELIEAAERANGDHVAPHDCYATGPMTGDPIRDLVACPGCELSAALARVKGGAA